MHLIRFVLRWWRAWRARCEGPWPADLPAVTDQYEANQW